jgi:hypothetical protein
LRRLFWPRGFFESPPHRYPRWRRLRRQSATRRVCGHPRPRIEGTHAGYINGRGHRTLKIELFVSHPRARHETKNNLAVLARTLVLVMCEENNAMPGRVHVIASRPSSYGEPQPTGTCGRRNRQSSPIVCNDRKDLAVDHLKRIGEISVRLTARRIRRICFWRAIHSRTSCGVSLNRRRVWR